MSYKAFVSSTYKDLKDHRAHVIRELRKAGFEVDPMEDWTAAANEPQEFSTERLEGCHLCVLLIARRRGHVPSGQTLSITQMEFDEARRRGIDILPFLLDDSVAEDKWPWEEEALVKAWRADVLEHFGVETFKKTAASLKIGPALTRWIQYIGPQVALRLYLESVKQHHGYIKFLGLPRLEDIEDAPIQRLFVEPAVGGRPVSPDIDPKQWPKTTPVREALAEHPRLVLLGDPGSGKSTLVDWLAWQLAEEGTSRLPSGTLDEQKPSAPELSRPARQAGRTWQNLVPLPMILRELRIGAGITWETLLQKLVDRPLGKLLTLANLERILAEGRAMIMLDGLDEIGDPQVRLDLRDAVWKAIGEYENCHWVLTSRIVGYDECRFDDLAYVDMDRSGELKRHYELDRCYVTPFDNSQVDQFAHNWFILREKTSHKAKQGAKDLLTAVRGDESTTKLGRIPNLLTMMALIFRVRARLPHGRALLYNEIAQAYLETIDVFRQISTRSEPLADKKRWLARVAFEMQRKRDPGWLGSNEVSPQDELAGGSLRSSPATHQDADEILASGDEVRRWIAAAMGGPQRARSEANAAEFVDFLGRRAGLLLPRGVDQFAFMHLSFQEYFAACFLAVEIASFKWAMEKPGIADGATKSELKQYARQTVWRETLVFLVELLAASDQTDWLWPTFDCLFGEQFADVADGDESARGQAALLARLAVDPHAGFGEEERWRAIAACCTWDVREQKRREDDLWRHDMDVLRTLLATESKPQRQAILTELATRAQSVDLLCLRLDGTAVADLGPLARLAGLRTLDLRDTAVADLGPLAGLAGLQRLDLSGTAAADLGPLAGLAGLEYLDLWGTAVTDLGPLAGLAGLQSLYLEGTAVADLGPLAGLAGLLELNLLGTAVADLAPLAGLKNVEIFLSKSQQIRIPKELEGRVHRC